MNKPSKRLRNWAKRRPFTTAVIVILMIVIPGFVRIEQTADEAHETANELALTEARETAEEEGEALLSCQTRNTFQQNTRFKFNAFIDAVEVAFISQADTPQRADAIRVFTEQLRESVDTDPEQEDRDCNGDKVYDHMDYLP